MEKNYHKKNIKVLKMVKKSKKWKPQMVIKSREK